MSHPITPSPELVQQWKDNWVHGAPQDVRIQTWLVTQAARWGADQELDACCEWLKSGPYGFSIAASAPSLIVDLRTARHPKPPSLAEEAMKALKRQAVRSVPSLAATEDCDTIRAALERLQELEQND